MRVFHIFASVSLLAIIGREGGLAMKPSLLKES